MIWPKTQSSIMPSKYSMYVCKYAFISSSSSACDSHPVPTSFSCERVDSIRVVWSENGTAPQEGEKDKDWFSNKKKVFYDKYHTTSLNNRFVPPEGLGTDSVFAVDDDIRVPCADLDFAYEVRKSRACVWCTVCLR